MTEDSCLTIHESSPALHYGQQYFRGLKAHRRKDGKVNLSRPEQSSRRMNQNARRLLIPVVPGKMFVDAAKQVVKTDENFMSPYGTDATLYLHPLLIEVDESIGVHPAPEYSSTIFYIPVGAYFKGGLKSTNFIASDYDHATPKGIGAAKVGENYAASLLPRTEARELDYSDCVCLDPATRTKIKEVGAANLFGITKDGKFITPQSPSVLPNIMKYSLLQLAEERLRLQAIKGGIFIDDLDQFTEVSICGTAAVTSPIGGIYHSSNLHVLYSETEIRPVTKRLYGELTDVQFGDIETPEDWIEVMG